MSGKEHLRQRVKMPYDLRKDRGLWCDPRVAPTPEPEVRKCPVWRKTRFEQKVVQKWWPLVREFRMKPQLIKRYVLRGKPSSNSYLTGETCETWNCTHLRVRSVYLGLAKLRQRRKARKAAKARPSQAVAAAQFQKRHEGDGSKKARRKGSIRRCIKQLKRGKPTKVVWNYWKGW